MQIRRHVAVEVDAGGGQVLYLADTLLHELEFEHLAWTSLADVDPASAVRTRRALLARAAGPERSSPASISPERAG